VSDGHIEKGCITPEVRICERKHFHKFLFFIDNFGCRYARKPFKGFKDADFDLVSDKILSQNMADWVGTQGQVKLAKKTQKYPHL